MPSYRLALRRTQKEVDAERKALAPVPDRRELQRLAKEAGIPANQSTEALVKALKL